jgi:hypothetical protein
VFFRGLLMCVMGVVLTVAAITLFSMLGGRSASPYSSPRGPVAERPAYTPSPAYVPPVRPRSIVPPATAPTASAAGGTARLSGSTESATLVGDPQHEQRVRTTAAELGAVESMPGLNVGQEAVLLIRGKRQGGPVWGSGPYTTDSDFAVAAVHAGLLEDGELGLVRVKVVQHEGEHRPSNKHGVLSRPWGSYRSSFTLEKIDVP